MTLQQRIDLLVRLGEYMQSEETAWLETKERSSRENGWFIPEFVEMATQSIARNFLERELLEEWTSNYHLPALNTNPRRVGIVMAGNIPLVGFHDLLCVYIAGNIARIKPSSKDKVLIEHLVQTMASWDNRINEQVTFSDMLKNCDAYIATGSNNTAGYFTYYFKKYPHIIRRNRTSIAVLTGEEKNVDLSFLADDVYQYFGLGCRNVTKIFVPEGYDFVPLLTAFKKYDYLADHHKYKNNYDYNLAIHLLNNKIYMSNPSILLIEDSAKFSPISQLNYEYYTDRETVIRSLTGDDSVQCIVGKAFVAFGKSQHPTLCDYADGADTLKFNTSL
ncbi:MAG: acyl-CoA reductase [Chitinophagaceae bacterium]|nr:acyl-CoA reductase [Chitinophagaceae bacterium]